MLKKGTRVSVRHFEQKVYESEKPNVQHVIDLFEGLEDKLAEHGLLASDKFMDWFKEAGKIPFPDEVQLDNTI